jgi:hypothetical protein
MSLPAARSRVLRARTQLETGRLDDVEPALSAAEGFLADLGPLDAVYAPAVHAQIAEVRAECGLRSQQAGSSQDRGGRAVRVAARHVARGCGGSWSEGAVRTATVVA